MISIITTSDPGKWDNIVRSFQNYDVNYLCDYAKAFQMNGDGEPILFYYEDNNTRAMNVIMKRDIALSGLYQDRLTENTRYDLSTPYGYGGFWVEGEDYEAVNNAYNSYCMEQGYVSEFVRFHLFSGYHQYYDSFTETITHNIVRNLELPLDDIFMDFEHKVRKNIKRANSYGLDVEIDYSGKRLDDFLEIYYGTMNRSEAKDNFYFTKGFFEQLGRMKDNLVYIHILYEGKVISTELVLYGTENCYSFLGGTNQDYFNMRPNDLLKYEIIKWAKEKGLKRFILGGGYGDDDGIYRYKKSLAPNGICDFYIGKKIFDRNKYNELLNMRLVNQGTENDGAIPSNLKGFFPKYRDSSL